MEVASFKPRIQVFTKTLSNTSWQIQSAMPDTENNENNMELRKIQVRMNIIFHRKKIQSIRKKGNMAQVSAVRPLRLQALRLSTKPSDIEMLQWEILSNDETAFGALQPAG